MSGSASFCVSVREADALYQVRVARIRLKTYLQSWQPNPAGASIRNIERHRCAPAGCQATEN